MRKYDYCYYLLMLNFKINIKQSLMNKYCYVITDIKLSEKICNKNKEFHSLNHDCIEISCKFLILIHYNRQFSIMNYFLLNVSQYFFFAVYIFMILQLQLQLFWPFFTNFQMSQGY